MDQRTCPVCREAFTPTAHNQRFCNKRTASGKATCRKAYENAKHRGTLDELLARPHVVGLAFDCAWCGDACVPGTDGVAPHATKFCGYDCKSQWHRVHVEGVRTEAQREQDRRDKAFSAWADRLFSPPSRTQQVAYRRALKRDPCSYCGDEATALDHIEPKQFGGADDWENRTPSCKMCNSCKGSIPLLLALLWIPRATEYHEMRRLLYAAA